MSYVLERDMKVKTRVISIGGVDYEVTDSIPIVSKVVRRGNSLYILIPSELAKRIDLREGDYVMGLLTKVVDIKIFVQKEGGGDEKE